MKSLVLAEKPSVARDIARVLGCHKNISGAIEGSNYIVTWALGHLVTLADPEDMIKSSKPGICLISRWFQRNGSSS